jgi:hypothetical protein
MKKREILFKYSISDATMIEGQIKEQRNVKTKERIA